MRGSFSSKKYLPDRSWIRRSGDLVGEDRERGGNGGANTQDMLSSRSRVNAAQCITGPIGKSSFPLSPLLVELHQDRTPKGAAPDQMLRQYPLGVRLTHSA